MATRIAPKIGGDKQKYIVNDYDVLLTVDDSNEQMLKCLEHILEQLPPGTIKPDDGGLICGSNSLAYLFLHLSRSHPDLKIGSFLPKDLVPLYLGPPPEPSKVSPHVCGIVSDELFYCAIAAAFHQSHEWVSRFLSHLPGLLNRGEGVHEWVYGRAGTLYLLRLMVHFFPACSSVVTPWYRQIIDFLLAEGPPWMFRDKNYLGAGHGCAGILVQIMLTDPTYAPRLEGVVVNLLDWQMGDGNWPAFAPGSTEQIPTHLVQWCHGAPGVVQCLGIMRPHFPALHARIDAAVSRGRKLCWERGLITKRPNLCHGISGNALVSFPPGPERDHFLAHTTEEWLEGASDIWEDADYEKKAALLLGWAGVVVGFMWRDKKTGVYMGYDDL